MHCVLVPGCSLCYDWTWDIPGSSYCNGRIEMGSHMNNTKWALKHIFLFGLPTQKADRKVLVQELTEAKNVSENLFKDTQQLKDTTKKLEVIYV